MRILCETLFLCVVLLIARYRGIVQPRSQYIHWTIILFGRYLARAVRRTMLLFPVVALFFVRASSPLAPLLLSHQASPSRRCFLILLT